MSTSSVETRTGKPRCKIVGESPFGLGLTEFDSDGTVWMAKDKKVYCVRDGAARVVRSTTTDIVGLHISGALVWAMCNLGEFFVIRASDAVLLHAGALPRRIQSSCTFGACGVVVSVDNGLGAEIVKVAVDHVGCSPAATGLFRIQESAVSMWSGKLDERSVVVCVSRGGRIEAWDTDLNTAVTFVSHDSTPLKDVNALHCTPNGKLWIGDRNGSILVVPRDSKSPKKMLAAHTAAVCGFVEMGDGDHLWSGSDDGTIVVWDSTTDQPLGTFHTGGSGIRSLHATHREVVSTLQIMDTSGSCSKWIVGEDLLRFRCRQDGGSDSMIDELVLCLAARLAGDADIPIPIKAFDTVPETKFVADAVLTMVDCSAIIGRALDQMGTEPITLLDDFTALVEVAVKAHSAERQLNRIFSDRGDLAPSLSRLPEKVTELLAASDRLESQAKTAEIRLKTEETNSRALRLALDKAEASIASLSTELMSEKTKGSPNQLQQELDAKNQFVMELLQIVKENTTLIDDLRAKARLRKTELTERTKCLDDINSRYADTKTALQRIAAECSDPKTTAAIRRLL